jgi:hypothetical protein
MTAQSVVKEPARAREAEPSVLRGAEPTTWRALLASPLVVWTVACLALAALSAAVLPTVPSYDPWSWIVWGREVTDPHLSFAVGGGPSWKPLPFIFTTIFGLFGGAAPTLWVIVARAGGLMGLVAGYRLARRVIGAGPWGVLAGVLAVAGIVLTQDWGYYMFRGTSEPLLIGTSLWAIDRHLAHRYGSAFGLAVATGLMRPEAWPFIAIYAIWLWLREPRLRLLVVAGLTSIPFFWFVPPWIGSGQPFLAAIHAQEYNGHLGSDPFLEVLGRGANLQVAPALIGGLAATLLAFVSLWRESPVDQAGSSLDGDRLTLWLAGLIVGWWAIVVATTLDGYPGLERFFLPAAALTCVLAGVGVVRVARLLGRVVSSRFAAGVRPALVAGAAALGLIALSAPFTTPRISVARAQEPIAARAVTRLDQLSAAVAVVGGHDGVYPCRTSFAAVNHSLATALAWKLHVTLGRVSGSMIHQGLMFVGPHDSIDGAPPPVVPQLTQHQLIAHAGVWRVYRVTSPGADTGCVGR